MYNKQLILSNTSYLICANYYYSFYSMIDLHRKQLNTASEYSIDDKK